MKLVVMSRFEIEFAWVEGALTEGPLAAAVCIPYPDGRRHRVYEGGALLAVLQERFSDCDENGVLCFPKQVEHPIVPMTIEQARNILEFVKKWKDEVEVLYFACYGGISRSRGVAAGIAAVFGWDDKEIYAAGAPNVHCKSLIIRAAREGS